MKHKCPECEERTELFLCRWYSQGRDRDEWDYEELHCPDCGSLDDYHYDIFMNEVTDNIEIVYRTRIDCAPVLAGGQLI